MGKHRNKIAVALVLIMCASLLIACGQAAPAASSAAPGSQAPQQSQSQAPSSLPAPQEPKGSAIPSGMMSAAPEEPDVKYAEHLEIIQSNNVTGTLSVLSPAANSDPTFWKQNLFLEALLAWNFDGDDYLPKLATSWSSTDYKTFVFKLRDDVYFHNGDKFTAQDIINTIGLAQEFGAGSPAMTAWGMVSDAKAPDPYTIEITLSQVNVDFYYEMCQPSAGILNKRAIDADADTGPWIGTGAYKVADFSSNEFALFERFDDHWDDSLNCISKSMVFRFIPEMSARTVRMQTGESHFSFGTSADDMYLFEDDPDYEVFGLMFNHPSYVSFNMTDPICADHNFRMAVNYALDRVEIALMARGEWAFPVVDRGNLWGRNTPYRADIPPFQQDLAKAREYLEQSIYNGEELSLAAANVTNVRAAQSVQQQLSLIGIKTRIDEFDTAAMSKFVQDPNSGVQLVHANANLNLLPNSIRHAVYPGGAQNWIHLNDPEINQLLDEVGTLFDESAREAHFKRVQERLSEIQPYALTYHTVLNIVCVSGFGGVVLSPDNRMHDFRQAYLIIG